MRTNWSASLLVGAAIVFVTTTARAQDPTQAGAAKSAAAAEVSVGTAVADHAITGAAESFPKGTAKLFCLSKVTGAADSEIEHVWYKGDAEQGRVKLKAYYQRYEPAKSADDVMGFRDATGGFELLSVEKSQPLHVEFLVKEKKGDTRAFGAFDVSPGESGAVKHFTLLAITPGASVADFKIDGAERTRVIDGAIAKLTESYVFPETAKKMGDSVRA